MKVVHLFKITGISGSERHLLTLLPRLANRGLEIVAVMMIEPKNHLSEFSSYLKPHGIKILRVKIGCNFSLPAFKKILCILKSEKPDLLHTHLLHGDLYGTLAARIAGIKKVISTKHNDDRFRKNWLIKGLNWYLTRYVARVVVISKALEKFCIDIEKIKPGKIEVIYYGLEEFTSNLVDKTLRNKLGYTDRHIVFGIIARLVEQKGHVNLLKAFKAVVREYPNARLVVVGDGPLKVKLKNLVKHLQLTTYVNFLGRRENTADIYNALDVFVHPSVWEGFGLVFLEAMSFSLPIVATEISAIPELVRPGETGILVPPGDISRLKEAMLRMIENPKERYQMGSAGKKQLSCFNVERMVKKTIDTYEKIRKA